MKREINIIYNQCEDLSLDDLERLMFELESLVELKELVKEKQASGELPILKGE